MPIQFDFLNNAILEPELEMISVKNWEVFMYDSVEVGAEDDDVIGVVVE